MTITRIDCSCYCTIYLLPHLYWVRWFCSALWTNSLLHPDLEQLRLHLEKLVEKLVNFLCALVFACLYSCEGARFPGPGYLCVCVRARARARLCACFKLGSILVLWSLFSYWELNIRPYRNWPLCALSGHAYVCESCMPLVPAFRRQTWVRSVAEAQPGWDLSRLLHAIILSLW